MMKIHTALRTTVKSSKSWYILVYRDEGINTSNKINYAKNYTRHKISSKSNINNQIMCPCILDKNNLLSAILYIQWMSINTYI